MRKEWKHLMKEKIPIFRLLETDTIKQKEM